MFKIQRQVFDLGKERQLRKQEEIRNTILEVARDIISKEGIQGLSIRKITNAIDYSPAIIYHYFKDKNAIIECLMGEGYRQILASVASVEKNEEEPEKEIKDVFTNYIKAALEHPEYYRAVMLNEDPAISKRTAILKKGISERSQTLKLLCDSLKAGMDKGRFSGYDIELTAQIIWTATFGLIMKLIVERDIPQQQQERLIEHHFNILFNGIMARKE